MFGLTRILFGLLFALFSLGALINESLSDNEIIIMLSIFIISIFLIIFGSKALTKAFDKNELS